MILEQLLSLQTSWSQLLGGAFWLLVLYGLLLLVKRWLALGKFGRWHIRMRTRTQLYQTVSKGLVVYELFTVLIISMLFIFISPIKHGILVVLLLAVAFSSAKNYIHGRLMLLNDTMANATKIKVGKQEGHIKNRGRFGLHLQTARGLLYLPYTRLMEEGVLLISDEDSSNVARLIIRPAEGNASGHLRGFLVSIPYLNPECPPDLHALPDGAILAIVNLKRSIYLPDLQQTLAESGWANQIEA